MAAAYKNTMERDILEAVFEFGEIRPNTQASKVLADKYSSAAGDNSPRIQVTAMLNYLLEERLLFPYFNSEGKELRDNVARAITPKGANRLQRLRHPARTWMIENWFPVVVSATTATIGLASIIVNAIVKSN